MAHETTHARKSKTLFLRNLPYSTTNEKLEEIFGDIGPLKTCFVVKPKGAEKCRGFGYVAYSMMEDAEKAKETIKSVDGRKIMIVYAERKKENRMRMEAYSYRKAPHVKEEVKEEATDEQSSGGHGENSEEDDDEEDDNQKEKSSGMDKQQIKYLWSKTLLVTGWKKNTSYDDVEKYITKLNIKNINKLEFPLRNCEQPTAMVRFKCIRDKNTGQRKFEANRGEKGYTLSVRCQKDSFNVVSQRALKQCRLIVRNLSFNCTEGKLHEYFEKFGDITEVKIPVKPDGKKLGFGFVQFENQEEADQAIKGMNMKPILGRPVAVDWTLPKDKFIAAQKRKEEPSSEVDKSSGPQRRENTKPQIKKEIKTEPVSEEEEEDTSDEGSFSTENDENDEVDDYQTGGDKSDSEEEDESNDEGFDETDEEDKTDEDDVEEYSNKRTKNKNQMMKRKSDVDEGRTLFIRNVAFQTFEETLEEELEKFGDINYCRLVMDSQTEHSKGMAFVQFATVEAANKCLEHANDESRDGGITVDGRKLCIALAVSRDKAKDFKEVEKKKQEDKRNLHLAREGMIRPGTQAAEGLSKEDLQKRMKVENMKREKLKNPNIFISATRLCVRNLPLQFTDKELKQLFLKVAGDKKAVINEVRIMRDLERVNGQGKAKSRGYGFVNFTEHKHALQALRTANNNPDLFQEKRRLIVEFSLENKAALQAKEKKLERHKVRVLGIYIDLYIKNMAALQAKENKLSYW
ncbi:RNA-binding protein 28-like [Argopecten irradians]|uniref:RNA-binding protein 28-like n=1 Tax=Argopecten irradians TaxID=31199 RepID=UPI003712FFBD